jgi:hypothetical protein
MKRFQDDFLSLLDTFRLEVLEREPNPVYGLSAGQTLNYLNPGWFVFARENGGEPAISERYGVGASVEDAMAGDAKDFYLEAFRRVLRTGCVWHHDYECSSANIFRVYHQSVYPLREQRGLLVVNSLVREQPQEAVARVPHPPDESLYVWQTGFIAQCSNCRRVQRVSQPEVWDWVPAWVERMPPNTSHTFCPVCFEYYWQYRGGKS